jgi:ADP-ribosylglycohydrolase
MANSLIENNKFDPQDIIKKFDQWYRQGYMSCTGHCFDIGNTTKAALLRYEETGEIFSGNITDPASNGSIMRLAPIPLFFRNDLEKTIYFAGESSRLTHAPQSCIDACIALSLFIHRALHNFRKADILSYQKDQLNIGREIEEILLGSYKTKTRNEISAKGMASTCLEAALWAFYHTDNFNEGVLLAVNLGEDSDTTGAVYGQLAGAFYGVENIRSDFLDKLWDREMLKKIALDLYER